MMISWSVSRGKILAVVALVSFHDVVASVVMAAPTRSSSGRHLQDSNATQTVAEILASDPELTKLNAALTGSDLLEGLTSFTLFAPTDAAFTAIADTAVGKRLFTTQTGYTAHVANLLRLHVVPTDAVLAADLATGDSLSMANDEMVKVGEGPTFTGPSNNETAPAKVTAANILATDGVIHKIDTVLLPAFWNLDVVTLAETFDVPSLKTLKELFLQVKDNPNSTAILAAAKSIEVTMFAPTDEAFDELGEAAIKTILADTGGLLLNILQNHVAPKVIPYDDLVDGLSVMTLRNSPLMVSRESVLGQEETVLLGFAVVLESILANNGILHTISNVLLSADDKAILYPTTTTTTNTTASNGTSTSAAPVMAPAPPSMTKAPVSAPTDTATTTSPTKAAVPTKGEDKTTSMPVAGSSMPVAGTAEKPTLAPAAKVATPPGPSSTAASGSMTLVAPPSLVAAIALAAVTTALF